LDEIAELDLSNQSKACILSKNSKSAGRTCTQKLLSGEELSLKKILINQFEISLLLLKNSY